MENSSFSGKGKTSYSCNFSACFFGLKKSFPGPCSWWLSSSKNSYHGRERFVSLPGLCQKLFHHNLLNFCCNQLQTFVAALCRLIAFYTASPALLHPDLSKISLCRYKTNREIHCLCRCLSHSSSGPAVNRKVVNVF